MGGFILEISVRHKSNRALTTTAVIGPLEPPGCAATYARLGWDAMALFGCAPKRPLDYLGSAGLVWAINGGRLLELHRDWAVIDIPVHESQRIFYRRNVDAAKISLPWARRD